MMEVIFKFSDDLPSEVRCLITENNGVKQSKTVPVDEFLKICTNAVGKKNVRIGGMPSGYIDGWISEDGKEFGAVIKMPAGVRSFLYKGTDYKIPVPNLVFSFNVEKDMIQRSFCAVLGEGGELFHYPFGNVYNDGHICFGSLEFDNLNTLKDLERVVTGFVYAETNDDLYKPVQVKVGKGKGSKTLPHDQKQLVEFLKDKTEWPKEVRLEKFGKTLDDLIAQTIKTK